MSTEAISQLQHKLFADILTFQFTDVELSPALTLLFYFLEFQLDFSCYQIVVTVGICWHRLASTLKPAWLGWTCWGYDPHPYSLQSHGGTQASPPQQGSNTRGSHENYIVSL